MKWSGDYPKAAIVAPTSQLAIIVFDEPEDPSNLKSQGRKTNRMIEYISNARENGALIIHNGSKNKASYEVVGEPKDFRMKLRNVRGIQRDFWPSNSFRVAKEKTLKKWKSEATHSKQVTRWKIPSTSVDRTLPFYRDWTCGSHTSNLKNSKGGPDSIRKKGDLLVDRFEVLIEVLKENGIRIVQFVGGGLFDRLLHHRIGLFAFFRGAAMDNDFVLVVANDLIFPEKIRQVKDQTTEKVMNAYMLTHGVFLTDSRGVNFEWGY